MEQRNTTHAEIFMRKHCKEKPTFTAGRSDVRSNGNLFSYYLKETLRFNVNIKCWMPRDCLNRWSNSSPNGFIWPNIYAALQNWNFSEMSKSPMSTENNFPTNLLRFPNQSSADCSYYCCSLMQCNDSAIGLCHSNNNQNIYHMVAILAVLDLAYDCACDLFLGSHHTLLQALLHPH